jgi:predicted nuclease of predicted toxin-antitoxin system
VAQFLIDESLPRLVATALAEAGHDALDCGLRGAPDGVVHVRSITDRRILVSGDTDFANALRFPPGSHPGIVVLRVPNSWSPAERARRLCSALDETLLSVTPHAIVIVEPGRVRVLGPPGPPK